MIASSSVRRYVWLTTGTALSLFALQSSWDIALLAWVFPVLLLRFSRSGGRLSAAVGIVLSTFAGVLFWLHLAQLLSPPLVALGVGLALPQAVPHLRGSPTDRAAT